MIARVTLLIIICSLFLSLHADSPPIDAGRLFLESDLIVHAKVHRDEGKIFRVRVIDVWAGEKYGIKSGDYLKIKDEVVISCGLSFGGVETEIGEGIFFLRKEPNIWRLLNGDIIPEFNNGNAHIWFNECTYKGTSEEWKFEIKSFRSEFFIDNEGNIIAKKSEIDIPFKGLGKMTYAYYLIIYPDLAMNIQSKLDCETFTFVPDSLPTKVIEDTTIFVFLEEVAKPSIPLKDLVKIASDSMMKKHFMFLEAGYEGRIYISLIIEKNGEVGRVELLRGLHPVVDKSVLEYFSNSAPWTPAKQRNKPVRFKTNLPILFRSY